jgi:Concanavalin A-like lectin/glucanases superfamily
VSVYSSYILSSYSTGLVVYYQMNDSSSPWADSGPNNLPLTSHAGFTLSQPSLLPVDNGSTANGCTLFSGTGYGSRAANAVFNSFTAFTINAWIQPVLPASAPGGTGYVMGDLAHFANILINQNNLSYASRGLSVAANASSVYDSVAPATPSMVTAVYDGAHIITYINGLNQTQTAKTGNTGTAVALGVSANGTGTNKYAGSIQHAALWSTALTAANLQDLYIYGIQGAYPGSAGSTYQAYAYPWSVEILPSHTGRKRVTLTNDSNAVIWVSLAATGAATGSGIQLLPYGGQVVIETYTGALCAIHGWNMGYKSLTILEE